MEPVTSLALEAFLQKLGERMPKPARLYLLGGSALCLLGSPRETLDVDYSLETGAQGIEKIINALATELKMDLEAVPLAEFIPLPPPQGLGPAYGPPLILQARDTVSPRVSNLSHVKRIQLIISPRLLD